MNPAIFLTSCFFISVTSFLFARFGKAGLTTWIGFCGLVANLFVLKQINLLGLNATASDAFMIGALFGLNLLQDKFGFKAAKEAIWVSFYLLVAFVVLAQLHLAYVPSTYDQMHTVYQSLLTPAPRLLAASLCTFLVVQHFDARLFKYLRTLNIGPASLLSPISIAISQAIDTILFTILGLIGIVDKPLDIMMVSYTIKLLAILCLYIGSLLMKLEFKLHA